MTQSKTERLGKVFEDAVAEFGRIQAAQAPERRQCLEDRRFVTIAGAQWDGPLGNQFENKPRFEFNKTALACIRLFSEYRNNRISVNFQSRDGADDELADACNGMHRADEMACSANEAYDTAFDEGTAGGIGAWRLRAEHEDEDDEDNDRQRILIEPIYDADTHVFFDLDARRYDKSDAKSCYVLTPYTREAYVAEFNDDPDSWPAQPENSEFDWSTPDVVWVCELYKVEKKTELVRFFRGLDEDGEDTRVTEAETEADPEYVSQLEAMGFREVRQKTIKRKKVRKYLMSGGGILEDCGIIAGDYIPVVMFYGKRYIVNGVERAMGQVRLAKDPQRLLNMIMSWLAEMAARFDIEKPIMSPQQIEGHALMWAQDNIKKYPYLLANMLKGADGTLLPGSQAPVAYTKAPNVPPAIAALAQLAEQGLQDLLGNQQSGEQMQPNQSGKAVELIQSRLDMQVFIYMSNMSKSMKRSGEIWLSMKRELAVEPGEKAKTMAEGGSVGSVVLNQSKYDPNTGKESIALDMAGAKYDVIVDVGPSSSSLRNAVVRSLTGVAQITQDPDMRQALTLSIIANLDGEGMSDLRAWARSKSIRMGLITPNDEEKKQLEVEAQNQKPDPQAQYLEQAAAAQAAKARKDEASTVDVLAAAGLKQAQTDKTVAETEGAKNQITMSAEDLRMRAETHQASITTNIRNSDNQEASKPAQPE